MQDTCLNEHGVSQVLCCFVLFVIVCNGKKQHNAWLK